MVLPAAVSIQTPRLAWFNPAAFAHPAAGHVRQCRAAMRSRSGSINLDMAVSRQFQIQGALDRCMSAPISSTS